MVFGYNRRESVTRTDALETWVELSDYPGYAVSDRGRIMNTNTDMYKRPARNQQGILMVNFSIRQRQHVRSVSLLVAKTFLDNEDRPEHFDTPIHLDGDKENCDVRNLMWRPRWFAIKYHQQFAPEERVKHHGFKRPVLLVDTEEVFPTSWEAATKYGLLDHEIMVATINRTFVFPTSWRFELIEE